MSHKEFQIAVNTTSALLIQKRQFRVKLIKRLGRLRVDYQLTPTVIVYGQIALLEQLLEEEFK